ncbi:MAG TPA: isoaspartyl peptidase/L-asparaginase, partial [Usitatibacteraceae bacterium]|nr:isoaspartyl peptidase/L-asparaginase [Usitatibacteraceae bacterium]
QRFARAMGHPPFDPVTPARHSDWVSKKQTLQVGVGTHPASATRIREFLRHHPEYAGGTIGAVALDRYGVLCAATSTGGVTLKMAGRVGDTPLPGCGNYAVPHAAASATGTGEYVIRSLATREIADRVAQGRSLQSSVAGVLDLLGREFDADVGFIALDANGIVCGAHRTPHMPHAWFSGDSAIVAKMHA